MKRKIRFQISVGSHFPEKSYPSEIVLPVGGKLEFKTIEFETDNVDPMKDASNALKESMDRSDYHIWYWTWLD